MTRTGLEPHRGPVLLRPSLSCPHKPVINQCRGTTGGAVSQAPLPVGFVCLGEEMKGSGREAQSVLGTLSPISCG